MSVAAAPLDDDRSGGAFHALPVALVAAAGALCVATLAAAPPEAPGARHVAAPGTLLAAFDTLVLLAQIRPGRRGVADAIAVLVVAAPFHAAIASAASAGAGFHVALAVESVCWSVAGVVASRTRAGVAAMAAAAFAMPLAAYGLLEFARLPVTAAIAASPTVGPVLLAHRATTASPADAVPSLIAAALVAGIAHVAGRRGR